MLAYLSAQGSTPGPLFILQDSHPLFCALLTDWLWQILSAVGISGSFFSSSFCIGVTTVAAHNGVPDRLIQSLGQWSNNAYQLYTRTLADALASLSQKLT